MEDFLMKIGAVLAMLLVLSTSAEVVVEIIRGLLGLRWPAVYRKVSIDESLALAKEFTPEQAKAQIEALDRATRQLSAAARKKLPAAGDLSKALGGGSLSDYAAELDAVLCEDERRRLFFLRALAAAVGAYLVYASDLRLLATISTAPGAQVLWVNILVGGLASAAGSSYWHDLLDRARNAKNAVVVLKDKETQA